ncbi:MAG: DUF2231 domain-containing protein, partial [Planctomycetota bacterium]
MTLLRLIRNATALGLVLVPLTTLAQEAAEPARESVLSAQSVWESIGVLHPAMVHFPVALLTVAAMFIVLGWVFKKISPDVVFYSLLFGALSSIVATALGWSFSPYEGYGVWNKEFDSGNFETITSVAVFYHRWSGVLLTALACLAALLAIIARFKEGEPRKLNFWWKSMTLASALLVAIVGHQGGELVYGEEFYHEAIDLALYGPKEIEPAKIEIPPHTAGATVDFVTQVAPIFEATCISCHGPEKDKGDLRLHTKDDA